MKALPTGSSSWGCRFSPLQRGRKARNEDIGRGNLVRVRGALSLPASCCSKLHTRCARLRVSACNLGAASVPGTLERTKCRVEAPSERLRDALSSCRVTVTACFWQAALNRGVMSSVTLRPKRVLCAARLSGVKQVLQSSSASVTLKQDGLLGGAHGAAAPPLSHRPATHYKLKIPRSPSSLPSPSQ